MTTVWPTFSSGRPAAGCGPRCYCVRSIRSEVVVGLVPLQHVVGGDGDLDRMRDRDLSPAHPTASGQPGVSGREVVLRLHTSDRAGSFDQHRGQPLVAVPFPTGR
jgi:hypothetical protein